MIDLLTQVLDDALDFQREALIRNAIEDLAAVRSDVLSELGSNPTDEFLKTTFTAGLDSVEENLRRALI